MGQTALYPPKVLPCSPSVLQPKYAFSNNLDELDDTFYSRGADQKREPQFIFFASDWLEKLRGSFGPAEQLNVIWEL